MGMKLKNINIDQKSCRTSKFLTYGKKSFGMAKFFSYFDERRENKQKNDANALFTFLLGFACKVPSMRALERFSDNLGYYCHRSVLESFLRQVNLPRRLRKQLKSMARAMQSGKMLKLDNINGRKLGAVDGVEVYRKSYSPEEFYKAVKQRKVCELCCVSVHRDSSTNEIIRYDCYHRVIVLSLVTNRGPMPIDWEFQTSTAGEDYLNWLKSGANPNNHPKEESSEQDVKQTGELTAAKTLITRLNCEYNGFLPFDTIVSDSLYDKANIIDLFEEYGIALIAGHKNKTRKLRTQAEKDFQKRKPRIWKIENTSYQGYQGVYCDSNRRSSKTNKVKIVCVERAEKGKKAVTNYFYCSNYPWMTPQFVEWCRHYRWKLESGFNDWTNKWLILKHMFHHHETACNSIIGLLFIAVIWVQNFWKGNLNRGVIGVKALSETYEEFFSTLKEGVHQIMRHIEHGSFFRLINSS